MVLQGHFHHSGILGHCIRTDKKQLQLDMSGELITSWLLAASRMLVNGQLVTTRLLVMSGEPYREQRFQLLLSRVSVNEKFSQTVLRGEGDWEQWHFLAMDISNSRDPMNLHHLFQGGSDGEEGKTEAGVAAAEGQFSITGAPNLSRLAVDGD